MVQASRPGDTGTPVRRVLNGVFASNCYLVPTGVGDECVVIDPGLDAQVIERALAEFALRPRAVLCTHGHFDHAGSAAALQQRHDCAVYLHEADSKTLASSNFLLMALRIPARVEQPRVQSVSRGDLEISVGERRFVFHPTPGHTPGSCLIECGDALFTGDTLYSRGIGLSRLPGENAEQLRASILAAWDRFGDDVVVHPGHGDPARLGWIKQHNQALRRFLATAVAARP
jgi:glyoxylase-like metal-dependent hydrolase (beta-lactamase superfamily II)